MGLFGERQAFLGRLSTADRTALLGLGVRRSYRAREHLVGEGERGSFVLVILSGWCAVRRSTERGELILGLRQDGELIGEMAALDNRPRSATVTALGPVEALVLPADRFRAFMAARPYVTGLVLTQLTARLRSADDERRALASTTVLERLAAFLVDLAERTGRPVQTPGAGRAVPSFPGSSSGRPVAVLLPLPLSQSEIASAVGATREAVAKALRLLREEGLVRTRPGAIVVADMAPLRLLGGDGGAAEGG
jgi:CRP/FNR family transcriptional regulator, cyclic AMP receptor protein